MYQHAYMLGKIPMFQGSQSVCEYSEGTNSVKYTFHHRLTAKTYIVVIHYSLCSHSVQLNREVNHA